MINPNNVSGKYPEMEDNLFAPYETYPDAISEYQQTAFVGTSNGYNGRDSGLMYVFDTSKYVPSGDENRPKSISLLPIMVA